MAHVAEQLVGRHAELTMVDAALTALDHGTSAAIELVGEPGIGKTRLLAELAHPPDQHLPQMHVNTRVELARAVEHAERPLTR
jgi:predicted ATPase